MAAANQYTSQLHDQLNYYATWLPGTPMRLGTIGTMQGKQFVPQGDLASLGFKLRVERDSTPVTFEYSTRNGIEVTSKTAGSISPDVPNVPRAKAGMKIKFKRADAVWFAASGCKMDRIANQLDAAGFVKDLYKAKRWNSNWVVVTHVVKAATATVLLSASHGASAELELGANADTKLGKAEASTRSRLKADSSMDIKIVADKGLTPLFRLMKLSDGWLEWWKQAGPSVGPMRRSSRRRRASGGGARRRQPVALRRVP